MLDRTLSLLLIVVVCAACSTRQLGPDHTIAEGIEVRLRVQPTEVRLHEPFTARVSVTNRREKTVTLVTRHSCIAAFEVYSGERPVTFSGTENGCFTAVTQHTLRPGRTVQRALPIWAETPEGGPVPRGEYILRASFSSEVFEINGLRRTLPDVEYRFVVR